MRLLSLALVVALFPVTLVHAPPAPAPDVLALAPAVQSAVPAAAVPSAPFAGSPRAAALVESLAVMPPMVSTHASATVSLTNEHTTTPGGSTVDAAARDESRWRPNFAAHVPIPGNTLHGDARMRRLLTRHG